ncbi:zinc finger MYM-type protein 1-like [Populus alba x Populus x berolinensis]|uniref:Zinc finger MYM-type protein 1-like n=1 Tax=Populus alba x Populus x berolinensis TaxID=444605 RepID=A0AAD6PZP7_9ROSI|nr:zinc finger MYM-type protein 1-like [Populus alba x Populus x berolinensis]
MVVLRYVDNNGYIIERFLGIQHVRDTTASSLKAAIKALFSKHGLSISRLRGQGYDGASNIQVEFNGLKTLIVNSNPNAFYVHCFAYRLQLTIVVVTKKHNEVRDVFNFISSIINIVGTSCKRMEVIREKQYARIIEGLENGEISSGRGLNQETSLRSEFSIVDLMVLGDQLDTYIFYLRGDDEFFGIEGLVQVERIVGLDSPWAALSFGGQPNKDGGSYLENKGWTHTPPRQLPTCRLNQLTRVNDG